MCLPPLSWLRLVFLGVGLKSVLSGGSAVCFCIRNTAPHFLLLYFYSGCCYHLHNLPLSVFCSISGVADDVGRQERSQEIKRETPGSHVNQEEGV